jgi:hypothetical protein
VLLDPGSHALHLPWVEQTRGKLADLALAPLYSLVRTDGYLPDFLVPSPTTPLPSFEDEMARVSETPAATVVREIEYLEASGDGVGPDRERLLASYLMDPKASLARLAESLLRYHEVAVAPHWPRLRVLLEGDVLKLWHLENLEPSSRICTRPCVTVTDSPRLRNHSRSKG